jgi:tetratricopeptide (TPR) repeat protein
LAFAHNAIAWKRFLEGMAAEGLADAEKAATLAPEDANFLDTRGQIYLAMGRADEAFVDLDRSIALGSNEAGTYYGRGRCHEVKANKDLAIADYRKSLGLPADSDYARSVHTRAAERLAALTATERPSVFRHNEQ